MVSDGSQTHLLSRSGSPQFLCQCLRTVAAFTEWVALINGSFDPIAILLDIADYRRCLLDQKKKPARVSNTLKAGLFAWAVQEAQLNPVAGVRRVAGQKGTPRWLSRREM